MTNVHKIEGTDNLLMQTIVDQAEDLENGWREAIQNGLDSPGASIVALNYTTDHTVVRDNGAGVDLDSEAGLALLKNLGETSKTDDDSTIGQFGIGKGQIIAKGRTAFISGETAIHFDIKEWGLTCKTIPVPEDRAVDGLLVVSSHYDDEVPYDNSYKWERYEERISDRFRFSGIASDTDVSINGTVISNDDPADTVGGDYSVTVDSPDTVDADFVAALEPRADGEVDVYSRGVYVKSVDGNGLGGVIVTRENLELNFARNGIKSGCPVWGAISEWLEDTTVDLLSDLPDSRLTSAARSFLAERALGGGEIDAEAPMFKTVTGDRVSLADIRGAKQVAFAHGGDQRARKLAEGWNMTILDTNDAATSRLQTTMENLRESMSMPDEFDVDDKADQVSLPDTHSVLEDSEINTVQARKLAAARELADRMGISRRVVWGESDISDAWTDGFDDIVLTNSAASSRNRSVWLPSVFRAVIQQWAHQSDSRGEDGSSSRYVRRYTDRMEDNWGTLERFITECERDGLSESVRRDHRVMLL